MSLISHIILDYGWEIMAHGLGNNVWTSSPLIVKKTFLIETCVWMMVSVYHCQLSFKLLWHKKYLLAPQYLKNEYSLYKRHFLTSHHTSYIVFLNYNKTTTERSRKLEVGTIFEKSSLLDVIYCTESFDSL